MPETQFGWPVLFGYFSIPDIRNIATDLAERGDKWSQTNHYSRTQIFCHLAEIEVGGKGVREPFP